MLIAIRMLLLFTLLLGVVYPLTVTAVGSLVFPRQAYGDPDLVGRDYSAPGQFWSRPSATAEKPYNAAASSGSNFGPREPKLLEQLQAGYKKYGKDAPRDLVTASASGLDPHITPESAYFQVERVARERGLAPAVVKGLVDKAIETKTFGVLGHPRVNLNRLNQSLEQVSR